VVASCCAWLLIVFPWLFVHWIAACAFVSAWAFRVT
jgi:hypothetical protein